MFSIWKSIVRRGLPFFLAVMCIGAHHVAGPPTRGPLITPIATSLSRSFFTSFSQCMATGLCLWMAKGMASFLRWSLQTGTSSITGRLCLSQRLKAESA